VLESFNDFIKSKIFGGQNSARDVIEDIIEEEDKSDASLDDEEKVLISNILELSDLKAEDIMVPRADIQAVPVDIKWQEIVEIFSNSHFTRLLAYDKTLDNVVGFVHSKDVLKFGCDVESFDLRDITKKVMFISPGMSTIDLILQMKTMKINLAVVVDEFGGTDGIITAWDILKEMIKDLGNAHETDKTFIITKLSDNSYLFDARTPIEKFEEIFGRILDDNEWDDIDTVGGLALAIADHMPIPREIIEHKKSNIEIEIVDADPTKIKQLCIRKK